MTLPSDNNKSIDASVVLGTNTKTGKNIIITDQERLRGISIIGTRGTGKSNLLKSLALQAIEKSECVVLISVEPDIINDLLVRIPQERMDDVIPLDLLKGDTTTLHFEDIIENNKILLIHLSERRIGAMLLEELKYALFSRADLSPHKQHMVNLICDEWQMFLSPDFFEDVLSRGRRFGISAVLATQTLANFDDKLQAIVDQVGTHISFAVGVKDAEKIALYYVKASSSEIPTRTFADMENEKVVELLHLPDGMAYVTIRMRGDRFMPRMKI